MLSLFGSLISGGVLGGLTGILGTWLKGRADAKMKKLDIEADKDRMAHELKVKEADQAIMKEEWSGRTKVATVEASGAEAVADAKAFEKSYEASLQYSKGLEPTKGQAWALVLLDLLRGLIRPGLTIYLIAITTMIYFQAEKLMGGDLPPEQAAEIVNKVIGTVLYLTTTCLTWWFGTRNSQKPPMTLGRK